MSNKCIKCGGGDILVRYVSEGALLNHSGRQRVEDEYVTSDEYDFYWKHTAAKEHLVKLCRTCQYAWRADVLKPENTREDGGVLDGDGYIRYPNRPALLGYD